MTGRPLPPNFRVEIEDRTSEVKTLAEARDEAKRLLCGFLSDLTGNRGKVLELAAPPGLGKTYIAVQVVNELTEAGDLARGDVAWFAQRHNLFGNVPGQSEEEGWVHIWGRHREGDTEPTDAKGNPPPANCIHARAADSLGRKGYGVTDLLCDNCEKHRACDYFDQFKRPGHKFYVFQHLWTAYPMNAKVLILDDFDPSTYFLERIGTTKDSTYLGIAQKDILDWAAQLGARPFGRLLTALVDTMALLGDNTLSGRALYGRLDGLTDLRAGLGRGRLPALPKSLLKVQIGQVEAAADSAPHDFVKDLHGVMAYEFDQWSMGQDFNGRLTLTAEWLRLRLCRELPSWVKDKAVVLLNATPNEGLEKMLFEGMGFLPQYSLIVQFPSSEVQVKQYVDRLIGKTALGKPDFRKRVVEQVGELLEEVRAEDRQDRENALKWANDDKSRRYWGEKPPIKVGVISHKLLEGEIKKLPQCPEKVGYFGDVKGSNEFEDCDVLLVVGTPTPNLDSFKEDAHALYWDKPRLNERQGYCRKRNVYYYPVGSRLRALMDAKREDELYQSVFRIRPLGLLSEDNKRGELRVYVLSSLPIPGLGVQELEWGTPRQRKLLRALQEKLPDGNRKLKCPTIAQLVQATGLDKSTISRNMDWLVDQARGGAIWGAPVQIKNPKGPALVAFCNKYHPCAVPYVQQHRGRLSSDKPYPFCECPDCPHRGSPQAESVT